MASSLLAEPLNLEDLVLTPYTSPVSPKQFGRLSGNLLFVAFVILSWFIMYPFLLLTRLLATS